MLNKLLLAAMCLLLAAHSARAQDKGLLRFRFNTGDVYHYSMELTGTGEMSMAPPELMDQESQTFDLPIDVSLYSEIEVNVTDVEKDGAAGLEMFLNRIRMNAGPDMVVDSDDEDEELPPFIEALFNEPIAMKIASDGGVLDAEFPDMEDDANELMGMFFPTDLHPADMLKKGLFKLPAQAVAPGGKWTQEASIPVPMTKGKSISFTYNFEMKGYESVKGLDCAAIEVSVKEDFSKQLNEIDLPGFGGEDEQVTMHFSRMSLDFTGTLYFAWKEGIFVAAEGAIEQDVSGAMTSSLEDESMTMSMNLIMDVKIELK